MASERPGRCSQHPNAKAGWICTSCGRALCQACCSRRKTGIGVLFVCDACGEMAEPIMVPRSTAAFGELIRSVANYPLSEGNWQTLAIAGVFFGVLKLAFSPGMLLATILETTFLFRIIAATAHGEKEVPEPAEFRDIFDIALGGFRGALGASLAIVPLWLYVWLRHPVEPYPDEELSKHTFLFTIFQISRHVADPISLVFIAIGMIWAPLGILAGAIGSRIGSIVNPFVAWRMLKVMGNHYYVVASVFWASFVVWWVLGYVALNTFHNEFFDVIPVPLAFMEPVRFCVAAMGARALGILLYTHGAELGYGRPDEYLVPALGNVLPEMVTAKSADEAPPEQPVEPIELPTNLAGGAEFEQYQPPAGTLSIDVPDLERAAIERPVAVVHVPASRTPATTDDLVSEEEFMSDIGMSAPKKE